VHEQSSGSEIRVVSLVPTNVGSHEALIIHASLARHSLDGSQEVHFVWKVEYNYAIFPSRICIVSYSEMRCSQHREMLSAS
jgi:hypothetical protein